MSTPLVTIRCLVYNHEPYLRQCLDGFVMQKTNFPFEAIVHDDASTDGTAAIIREYAEKYPDIIKPIFETENQYSKHDGSIRRIMNAHTHGKYVAMCEGDDYWIDSLKLQKQVDFLEGNPEYSMCFHNAKILNESNIAVVFRKVEGREYFCGELYDEWIVPTASIMVRAEILHKKKADYSKLLNGDIFVVMSAFELGKVYGMTDIMSVYRVHYSGVTMKRAIEDNLDLQFRYLSHYQYLSDEFKQIPVKSLKKKMSDTYINLAVIFFKKRKIIFFKYLYKGFEMSPSRFIQRLKRIFRK